MARQMSARYAGKCRGGCGRRIRPGDAIMYQRGDGAYHVGCYSAERSAGSGWAYGDDGMEAAAERALASRDEAEYQRGYHEVAQIQAFAPAGSALRDQMYAEMEMAAYNRGEDY